MKACSLWIVCFGFLLGLLGARPSREKLASLEFEQKLNTAVPQELSFTNDNGGRITLGSILAAGKPVILVPGYYKCPMLCTLVLNGLVDALQQIKLTPGRDFSLVFFSINPEERSALAMAKKRVYVRLYGRGNGSGWYFLTDNDNQAALLSEAIGFKYVYDSGSKQYAHPSGFVLLTPEGRIARYFFGVDFAPKELRYSLVLAGGGKIGSPAERLMLLCFHDSADPFSAAVLWGVRVLTLIGAAAMGLFVYSQVRRTRPPS